jgi:SAM-dependent methyltransferase
MSLVQVKEFWENCDLNFAHNTLDGHLPGYEKLVKSWEKDFIKKIDFKNKVVLDYGLGGGYLGKYLFEKKKIESYYGVDISQRSIDKANEVLNAYKDNKKIMSTEFYYSEFTKNVDIFICQACIQHFPSEKYLKNFLLNILKHKPKIIMLQIARGDETIFSTDEYSSSANVVRQCYTNKKYLIPFFSKEYKKPWISKPKKNNYQFFIFERKPEPKKKKIIGKIPE